MAIDNHCTYWYMKVRCYHNKNQMCDWNGARPSGDLPKIKAFLCPLLPAYKKKVFIFLDLPWVWKGRQTVIRRTRECRKKPWCRESAWAWFLSWVCAYQPDAESLSSLQELRPPVQVEDGNFRLNTACGSQTAWNQKAVDWDFWNTILLLHHQPIREGLHATFCL